MFGWYLICRNMSTDSVYFRKSIRSFKKHRSFVWIYSQLQIHTMLYVSLHMLRRGRCQISTLSFRGSIFVKIVQNFEWPVPGLLLIQCILYCTGGQFYPMSLIDRNIDTKNIVCFGVLTPQTWFKMNEVAFLGLIIWKRRGAANLLMSDLNSTPKSTPRYKFSELWGVPLQIYGLLNIIIRTAPRFWRWPP